VDQFDEGGRGKCGDQAHEQARERYCRQAMDNLLRYRFHCRVATTDRLAAAATAVFAPASLVSSNSRISCAPFEYPRVGVSAH
jgi:hypothetical protein